MPINAELLRWIVMWMALLFCGPAFSQVVIRQPVVDSYSNCTWRDNGDGSVTASLVANFKEYTDTSFSGRLSSRTIMPLAYDKDGHIYGQQASGFAPNVVMNGIRFTDAIFIVQPDWPGTIYSVRYGTPGSGSSWRNTFSFAAFIEITFQGRWAAISVTAGDNNVGGLGYYEEITGAAYLYPDSDGSNCQVVEPFHPPKPPVTIRMSAPDWNLGELPMDRGEKRFTALADQLCFAYSGLSGGGVDVVVDADSQNGVVQNQYQLKNLTDPTQVVPYRVVLNDGTTEITLPNLKKAGIKLNQSGRTCLAPTFHTYVRPMLKKGDYSDVLTFTVVTKT